MDSFVTSTYFGLVLSLTGYYLGVKIREKTNLALFNPLFVSAFLIICVLVLLHIPYESFNIGASYLTYLLTPATVCLALPLYREIKILKKHFKTMMIALLAGCLTCFLLVILLALFFKLENDFARSLLPKSITTAIAIGVSEEIGGISGITVAAVVITGILSAMIYVETPTNPIFELFNIHHPIAQGLALGAAGHAIGTSKALEMGEIQGAMSSLAIVVMGILTVVLAPVIANFIH